MKAANFCGPFDIRIEERDIPVPGNGEVLIKMKAVGICGSDIHFYDGSHPYKNYPRVYGHEMAGIVEEVTEGVSNVKKGDRVAIEPMMPCGTCYACRIGKYNCCANLKVIGAHLDGGFAEYLALPAKNVFKIPVTIPFDVASVFEPYTIGSQCMKRAQITKDDTVLVIGAGAIGLTVIDFIKNTGARIIAADVHPFRIEAARSFGADVVINSKEQDLLKTVLQLTNNEGASVVIEATGVSKIMEMTEDLVTAGGRIIIIGLTNDKVSFTGINFTKKEMTILGSRNSTNAGPYVVDMVTSGKLHPDKLISRKFKFEDIKEAFEYTHKNLCNVSKVVIEFN